MANATRVFYEASRDAFDSVDGSVLHWDAVPIVQDEPWFNVFKVSDSETPFLLCNELEGEFLFQYDGYGKDRYGLYDQLEAFHLRIRNIKGVLNGFNFYENKTSGVRSLGEGSEGYHHYIFETLIRWEAV